MFFNFRQNANTESFNDSDQCYSSVYDSQMFVLQTSFHTFKVIL